MRTFYMTTRCLKICLAVLSIALLAPTSSQSMPLEHAMLCDQATVLAAQEFDVPPKIMKAIARTESGLTIDGTFTAWPWTINVAGTGARLTSKQDAVAHFKKAYNTGQRNIDVGCFQINYRWHGRHFNTVHAMLDPVTNARYAARFLKELYEEFGDWTSAAGAFHSRTETFSTQYLARLRPILNDLGSGIGTVSKKQEKIRHPNRFPLLTGQSQAISGGSLFPVQQGSRGSLIAPAGGRG